MSERKSINKWYPPDYDPSKVKRRKLPKGVAPPTQKVRLMAPYSMRCTNCNEYIAARRKFNARKEVTAEKYMNFKILRFYITCPRCNGSITFKTSPQTAGYVPENGAVRNFEKSDSSAKQSGPAETEDDILERLEAELKREEQYKLMQSKRKFDPFWKPNELVGSQGGDVMENLQRKLDQEQRQQAMYEELEVLQDKQSKLKRAEMVIGESQPQDELSEKDDDDDSDLDEQLALEAFRKSAPKGESTEKTLEELSTTSDSVDASIKPLVNEPVLEVPVQALPLVSGPKTFKITKKANIGSRKTPVPHSQPLVAGYSLSSEDETE